MSSVGILFGTFFRIGIFSFGGGYAMLPLIFQSVQQFMPAKEFSNLVALSQVTPGPIAVNAATYVGFYEAGILGAAVATLGVCLPSFVLVLTAAHFLEKFKKSKGLQAALTGVRPVVVGLIASAAVMLAQTSLVGKISFPMGMDAREFVINAISAVKVLPCIIFICTMVLVLKFKISPIKIIILMGVIGAFVCG